MYDSCKGMSIESRSKYFLTSTEGNKEDSQNTTGTTSGRSSAVYVPPCPLSCGTDRRITGRGTRGRTTMRNLHSVEYSSRTRRGDYRQDRRNLEGSRRTGSLLDLCSWEGGWNGRRKSRFLAFAVISSIVHRRTFSYSRSHPPLHDRE